MTRITTTTITVHPAAPDEWQLYRDLRLTALSTDPAAFGIATADEEGFTEERWRQRLTVRNTLLAEAPDLGPCGLAGVWLEQSDAAVAELVSVWVAPAARRRGVGKLLVGAALLRASALGCGELRLWVAEDNPAAQRLYARLGFTRTGGVQPVRDGEPPLEVEMARATAEPPIPHKI